VSLPKGWVKVTLNDIGKWGSGGTPKRTNPAYYGGDIPWLIIGDINDGYVNEAKTYITQEGLENSSAKLVPANTLLIAMYGSIGKLGITEMECATNQAIAYCHTTDKLVNKKFVFYYLLSMRQTLLDQGKGGAQQNISQTVLKAFSFPLPPLNEQKRIAQKLDEVLSTVESIKTRLDNAPSILKRFRQSILAAATSGKLTEEWRIENGIDGEWGITKLGNLIDAIESGKNIRCIEYPPANDEVGIVKISAVTWGEFNENESKTLSDTSLFLENRRIKIGDFLISRANTLELVGAPVIVKNISRNLMLSDKVLRLVMNKNEKDWVKYILDSSYGRKNIELRATGNQFSMRNISQKALKDIPIPMPSESEKKELVSNIKSLFILADSMEAKIEAAQKHVNKLTQSILAKAFRGELVPQDPNDEPAQMLFERIRVEQESVKGKKSRGKKG